MSGGIFGAITGFITGLISSIFASGVRKMLARKLLPRKVTLSKITKSLDIEERFFPFYYSPVIVKTSKFSILLFSSIDNVRAEVDFITHKDNIELKRHYLGTWWFSSDTNTFPSVTFNAGGKYSYRIYLATLHNNILNSIESSHQDDVLNGDFDISIELISADHSIGKWTYSNAIINGCMKEVESKREQ